MNEIHLGEMINYYRKQNGWTMKQLGEKMGKTESAVSLWISNKRSPMVDDLDKLSKLFNVSPEILMFGNNNAETTQYIKKTVEVMNQLEEQQQKLLLKLSKLDLDDIIVDTASIMSKSDERLRKQIYRYANLEYSEYEKEQEEKNVNSQNTAG